jgi:hypothetical protein
MQRNNSVKTTTIQPDNGANLGHTITVGPGVDEPLPPLTPEEKLMHAIFGPPLEDKGAPLAVPASVESLISDHDLFAELDSQATTIAEQIKESRARPSGVFGIHASF